MNPNSPGNQRNKKERQKETMLPCCQDRINRHERTKQKQNQNQNNYQVQSSSLED